MPVIDLAIVQRSMQNVAVLRRQLSGRTVLSQDVALPVANF